ncbi:unnamed protein product [Nezara viridula]|uniref:Uncharacterized protein n=1 Tax=Nezara viridula TaxID=85310 RepID=A0A9P0MV91_NEZVI|nr:unnamed protein product [Nezara viridula]
MGDPDINEYLAMMDPNGKTAHENCHVRINYKPIVVPGLVYRTIITGGFLQLMMTNDQYACVRFNNMIKCYEDQRQGAIQFLKKEAEKINSKRLVVPPEQFLQWMKQGCIDLDTYVVLRDCVLKKGYKKRMALRKELNFAKTLLAPVGKATSALIDKIDIKDFSVAKIPPPVVPSSEVPDKVPMAKNSMQFMCNPFQLMTADFFCLPENSEAIPTYKQALCGMMFGLLAAKVVCTILLRMISPKETLSIT